MGRDGNMPGDGITGVKMWEYPEQAVSSRNHQKSYNKAIKFPRAIPRATHQHFIEVSSPHCNATVFFLVFLCHCLATRIWHGKSPTSTGGMAS